MEKITELLALNWSGFMKPDCTLNEGYIAPPTKGEMIEIPKRDFWIIVHRIEATDIQALDREPGQLVFFSDRGYDRNNSYQNGHIMANMPYHRNQDSILVREDFYKRSSECLGYARIQKLFYQEETGTREELINFPCSGN